MIWVGSEGLMRFLLVMGSDLYHAYVFYVELEALVCSIINGAL